MTRFIPPRQRTLNRQLKAKRRPDRLAQFNATKAAMEKFLAGRKASGEHWTSQGPEGEK